MAMNKQWLILGGIGAAGVVIVMLVTRSQGNAASTNTLSDQASAGTGLLGGITSNTGTPTSNNNSLLGFTDATSGVQWVLNASDQWTTTLPAGSLPPNYTPGGSYINPIQGDPAAYFGLTPAQWINYWQMQSSNTTINTLPTAPIQQTVGQG